MNNHMKIPNAVGGISRASCVDCLAAWDGRPTAEPPVHMEDCNHMQPTNNICGIRHLLLSNPTYGPGIAVTSSCHHNLGLPDGRLIVVRQKPVLQTPGSWPMPTAVHLPPRLHLFMVCDVAQKLLSVRKIDQRMLPPYRLERDEVRSGDISRDRFFRSFVNHREENGELGPFSNPSKDQIPQPGHLSIIIPTHETSYPRLASDVRSSI